MNSYLVFQLAGMQGSWGGIACGERRQSHQHPTKSAIIGLIAASLGIKRSEHEKLNKLKNIQIAVQQFRCENYLNDFHTTQSPSEFGVKKFKKQYPYKVLTRRDELSIEDSSTVLSTREYWMDMYYRVAITIDNDEFSLETIQTALEYPKFHLYLGRKSCPLCLPLNPVIIQANNLIDLFETTKIEIPKFASEQSYSKSQNYLTAKSRIFCDTSMVCCDNVCSEIRDEPSNRNLWEFNLRKKFELLTN